MTGRALGSRSLASNREIQAGAADLVGFFRSRGFVPSGRLKDPWEGKGFSALGRVAAIGVVPAILAVVVYVNETSSSSRGFVQPVPAYAPYSPPPTADVAPSSTADNDITAAAPTTSAESICLNMPANGQILTGRNHLRAKGHVITIENGSGGNAIVKVRDAFSGSLVASMFVANNGKADLKSLRDGSYRIQYAFGDRLGKNCKSFVGLSSAGEFPDMEQFQTIREPDLLGTMIRWSHVSYTLYAVPSGNVHPNTIDPVAFEAP